jgi:hypothetical protein
MRAPEMDAVPVAAIDVACGAEREVSPAALVFPLPQAVIAVSERTAAPVRMTDFISPQLRR